MSTIKSVTDHQVFRGQTTQQSLESDEVIEKRNEINFPNCVMKSHAWLFDGIRIMHSTATFTKPGIFEWDNELDIVHLHFNLKGKTIIKPVNFERSFRYLQLEHNIAYSNGFRGEVEYCDPENENFVVQFSKESFLKITADANDVLKHFAEEMMKGEPMTLSDENLVINMPVYSIIQNILNCEFEGKLKKMYLWSKCMELLVLQADTFDKLYKTGQSVLKSDYDRERLSFARDYILNHTDDPPTIKALSRIVGINEFKLKKGFKELFGNTIFGLLSDFRLEKAHRELMKNEKTVAELALELGYSSPAHLSHAFKKKYGISPRQIKA